MRIRFDRAALICASGLVCMADGGRASIKTPMIRATLCVGAETRVLKEWQQMFSHLKAYLSATCYLSVCLSVVTSCIALGVCF